MALNDIWQLTVSGLVAETQHIHTLHFREGILQDDGSELLTTWAGAPRTAYRALFGIYYNPVQQIEARKVCGSTPLPSPDVTAYAAVDSVGTRGTGLTVPEPAYMALLVTEKGTLSGRRYSGRFFIGGVYQDDINQNTVTAGAQARLQTYVNALKTAFVTPALPAFKLFAFSPLLANGDQNHTKRNPVQGGPRVADPIDSVPCQLAGSDVKDLIVSTRPTTMRSRKWGHGG